MTKLEMVEKMRITIVEMSEILNRANVELDVPSRSEELKTEYISDGYKWIYQIIVPKFLDVMEIWKLLPKELWERYDKWGVFEEHREVVLLEERMVTFKKYLKDKQRPDFFKRSKINAKIKALDKKASRRKTKQSDNGSKQTQ